MLISRFYATSRRMTSIVNNDEENNTPKMVPDNFTLLCPEMKPLGSKLT